MPVVGINCPFCKKKIIVSGLQPKVICQYCHRVFFWDYKYCKVCLKTTEFFSVEYRWKFWVKEEKRFIWVCFNCGKQFGFKSDTKREREPNSYDIGQSNKHLKQDVLTASEINYLVERAESFLSSKNYNQAIECYNQLIQKSTPHPHYFKKRSWAYRMSGNLDSAIVDMNKAIELDPDDANTYWERGACYAHKLSLSQSIDKIQKRKLLENILTDYKASINRNPTNQEGQLAVIETDLLLHDWYDAIGHFGECKSNIESKEYQLVRAWLGCLALTFAGEPIEEEDQAPLSDRSIKLKRTSWCVSEIDSLLIELAQENFDKEKLSKAKYIHDLFLEHFVEPPIRFK